jgi:DnaJ-domain-containing protein 1
VSIGKRLINLARSELNSLLDRAAQHADEEDLHDDAWGDLHGITDSELEAELERRRQAREEAEHAARGTRPPPGAKPASGSRQGPRPQTPRRTPSGDEAIRRAYAALEVAPGSDFDTVRKAYRRLMRKYHPDLHTSSKEATRAANDLAQKLTESYKLLEKQLRK